MRNSCGLRRNPSVSKELIFLVLLLAENGLAMSLEEIDRKAAEEAEFLELDSDRCDDYAKG